MNPEAYFESHIWVANARHLDSKTLGDNNGLVAIIINDVQTPGLLVKADTKYMQQGMVYCLTGNGNYAYVNEIISSEKLTILIEYEGETYAIPKERVVTMYLGPQPTNHLVFTQIRAQNP